VDPEELFYDIRRARAAQAALTEGVYHVGGIVDLPTYVILPGPTGNTRTWGLFLNVEPGSVLPVGIHRVGWSLRTYEEVTSGQMLVLVAPPRDTIGRRRPQGLRLELALSAYQQGPATTSEFAERMQSSYRPTYMALRNLQEQGWFNKTGDGKWQIKSDPLPGSKAPTVIYVQAQSAAELVKSLQRNIRQGHRSMGLLIGRYDRMIIKQVKSLQGHIKYISTVFTMEDAHAVGQHVVAIAAVKFASNSRPVCTFSRSVMDALRRDIARATNRATGESILLGECRAWLFNHPQVHTYQQALEAGLSDRFTEGLFDRAVQIPRMTSLPDDQTSSAGGYSPDEPLFAWDSLIAWGEAVGVAEEDVRWWAWWRGMLDGEVRTSPQIKKAIGDGGVRKVKDTDRRMFRPFQRSEQRWSSDKDVIRAQAFRELVVEGGLLSPNLVRDIIERTKRANSGGSSRRA